MRLKTYRDVHAFYRDTADVLMQHEAQNLIPLGNLIIGCEGKDKTGWRDPANWLMAVVSDGEGVRLTALMTPPHNLTLYATDNQTDDAALACLIEGIAATDFTVGGVMTEKSLAGRFARMHAEARGMSCEITCSQRIYELTRVNPEIHSAGALRLARESDMAFLPYWMAGFNQDAHGGPPTPPDAETGRYMIDGGRLYILEDGETPVSFARINREVKTLCGVGPVYTPPYFRNRGYATACVAGVSRLILERGFAKCVLYTDLANPTSNSIYQKIGYRPLCDSVEIRFVAS